MAFAQPLLQPSGALRVFRRAGDTAGDKAERQFLNPGDAPEAEFKVASENVTAREYCNLHGLWKG